MQRQCTSSSKEKEILQEIIVKSGGIIEIPWIRPEATSLITAICNDPNMKNEMPVVVLPGNNIYCG